MKESMTPEVERLPKDVNIYAVAQKGIPLNVGMIPVYDGDRLVEMVTDRDRTLRVVAEGATRQVPPHIQ